MFNFRIGRICLHVAAMIGDRQIRLHLAEICRELSLEALCFFMTNLAGSARVTAMGPIRRVVRDGGDAFRRHLVVGPGSVMLPGRPAQMQVA